jgi:hypothetical protein
MHVAGLAALGLTAAACSDRTPTDGSAPRPSASVTPQGQTGRSYTEIFFLAQGPFREARANASGDPVLRQGSNSFGAACAPLVLDEAPALVAIDATGADDATPLLCGNTLRLGARSLVNDRVNANTTTLGVNAGFVNGGEKLAISLGSAALGDGKKAFRVKLRVSGVGNAAIELFDGQVSVKATTSALSATAGDVLVDADGAQFDRVVVSAPAAGHRVALESTEPFRFFLAETESVTLGFAVNNRLSVEWSGNPAADQLSDVVLNTTTELTFPDAAPDYLAFSAEGTGNPIPRFNNQRRRLGVDRLDVIAEVGDAVGASETLVLGMGTQFAGRKFATARIDLNGTEPVSIETCDGTTCTTSTILPLSVAQQQRTAFVSGSFTSVKIRGTTGNGSGVGAGTAARAIFNFEN